MSLQFSKNLQNVNVGLFKPKQDHRLILTSYISIVDRMKQIQQKEMETKFSNAELASERFNPIDYEFLVQVRRFIMSNINSGLLKPDLLAKYFNVSLSTFERKLKALTNKPPGKLILEIKLEYAKDLILTNDRMNIDIIANKVGFKSASAFTRSFKKKYKLSPMQLRNIYKTANISVIQ